MITLSQFQLKEVINQTIFSIAINDNNKMMTGELFEVNEGTLKVVGLMVTELLSVILSLKADLMT